jgi:hypothetical protein
LFYGCIFQYFVPKFIWCDRIFLCQNCKWRFVFLTKAASTYDSFY